MSLKQNQTETLEENIKKTDNPNVGGIMEQQECSCTTGDNLK